MPLEAGRQLLHYRLVEKIGEGGMGVVWRGIDTTLDREVAVKILPPDLTTDAERLARFSREAKLLASVNHPGIASVYGLHEAAGIRFIAMEYVPGEDLAVRLARGPLPVHEALEIARHVAGALEAAHEQGVVHRDLKPANVCAASGHKVKVLDFGLAKVLDPTGAAAGGGDPSSSPTLTSAGTVAGLILGTAAYMSPEQAKGKAIDRRSDIWSFGVLLWEMLTGQRLFQGETISDTVASVLRAEIDWSVLPAAVPAPVVRLLQRCLERDPHLRLQAIGEARIALERPDTGATIDPSPPRFPRAARLAPLLLLPAAGLGLAVGLLLSPRPPAPLRLKTELLPPPGTDYFIASRQPGPVAMSPDGTRVVFAARDAKRQVQLWVRRLEDGRETLLAGTENGSYPFWSFDSRSIGFFSEGKLRRVDSEGGPVLVLCDAPWGKGGDWNAQGTIIFSPSYNSPLHRVSSDGGPSAALTTLGRAASENSHRFPVFLPDGKRFLFLARRTSTTASETNVLFVGSLEGGTPREVMRVPTNVVLSAGHLLYVRDTVLLARRFDAESVQFTGEPYPIAEDVGLIAGAAYGIFSASDDGVLVLEQGGESARRLSWFGLAGEPLGTLGEPGLLSSPRISPDGRRIAVTREERGGKQDVWVEDAARGAATRITSGSESSLDAVWMPDGKRLIYRTRGNGNLDLFSISAEGVGKPTLLLSSEHDKQPTSVSPDGRLVLFHTAGGTTGFDLWVLPLVGGSPGEPAPYLTGPYDEIKGCFSPDARWVAYESNQSGRTEIYVASFPEPTVVRRVSNLGAESARWSPDGRRIVFASPTGALHAAEVSIAGGELSIASPKLFLELDAPVYENYDLTRDRILLAERESYGSDRPLTLSLGWQRAE